MNTNRYRFPNQTQPQPRPGLLDILIPNNRISGIDLRCLPSAIRAQNELLCPSNPNLNNLQINIRFTRFEKFTDLSGNNYNRLTIIWDTNPNKTCLNKNFTNNDYIDIYYRNRGYSGPNINLSTGKTYNYMDVDSGSRFYKTVFKGIRILENEFNLTMYINNQRSTTVQVSISRDVRVLDEDLNDIKNSNDDILDVYRLQQI